MKVEHVPRIDGLYWLLLVLSGVFGTNAADFFSDVLGLGHAGALAVLLLCCACVRVAARGGGGRHPAGFWLPVALVRAAGASAADVLHDLRWSVLLAALMCVTVFAWSPRQGRPGAPHGAGDGLWWWTMFVASAAASALADAVAAGLDLGFFHAGLVLAALAALLLLLVRGRRPLRPGVFWLTILALQAAAGAAGDACAQRVLGLELSTFAFGVGFGLVLTALRILADGDLPPSRPRA
ncbi:hypothetical protein [Massilia sp. Root335]|uniref:hypothetical protein n=1 Tax=Massilia sp. Root335 TaxID=1736517 RepID=UPI0007129F69|nr:hypothetical protein [Massilia sp. Root335]KQV36789.1 hypothetical protein ASC93_21345 [Massilia sp. Root335]